MPFPIRRAKQQLQGANMDQPNLPRQLAEAFKGKQRKATIILLTSPVLCAIWWYFGRFPFYRRFLADHFVLWDDPGATGAIYMFLCAFLILGLIPALIVKLLWKERLRDYGVQLGNWRLALGSLAVMAPLWLVSTYIGSRQEPVLNWYPMNPSAGTSAGMFLLHACTYAVFYLGFEFHFRGYVQFGLRESVGQTNAILIGVLMTVLIHLGKPIPSEAFGALFAGLLWGVLDFRAKSLLPGLLQHFFLGLTLDLWICFG